LQWYNSRLSDVEDVYSMYFCLQIFPYDVRFKYLSLFNGLWRAKRIERLLSNMWRSQAISARELRKMTGSFTIVYISDTQSPDFNLTPKVETIIFLVY
jgi:hypothetical protein